MTDRTFPPGFHQVVDRDPDAVALDLAESLDAELVLGRDDLEQVLAARESDRRAIEPATLKRLRELAVELEKAERIRARTEAKVVGALGDQLATGTGVAVHPAAIRDAASALVAAREALDSVERAEAEMIAATQQVEPAPPEPEPAPRAGDIAYSFDSRPAWRRGALVIVIAIAIAAVVSVASLVPVYVAAVLPLIAVAWTLARVRQADHEAKGSHTASSHLSEVGAATDELFGRRQMQPSPGRSRALEVQRNAATERLRAAERQWNDLAGPGADPDDVEAVMRRRDPQLHRAEIWAAQSAAVRTAAAMHRKARARWRVAWAALEQDAPPAADATAVIDELAADGDAPIDRRPVVLAGTAAGVHGAPPDRLLWLSRSVPVIVVRTDATEPGT